MSYMVSTEANAKPTRGRNALADVGLRDRDTLSGSQSAGQEQKPDERVAFKQILGESQGMRMLSGDELVELLRARPSAALIGVDGLPVSGKSTLADRLIDEFVAQAIYLDDFVLPQEKWPSLINPAFPFPYIRHEEFFSAVEALAQTGACRYQLYDWNLGSLGLWKTVTRNAGPVVVEGVSALAARLARLYDVRIWVESDASTTLEAALARGVGPWETQWRTLFMPSVDLYMATASRQPGDMIVAGRGARLR